MMSFRLLAGLTLLALIPHASADSVIDSVHNLSVSGPGPVRALSEDRVCIFCHTPHGARNVAPLWNRNDPTVSYLPYDSPTLKAQVGQPTGASKLCLSCHDGTIALGEVLSEGQPISMAGGVVMPPGPGLIGSDLRDDHPISFDYQESQSQLGDALTDPASWPPQVSLDGAGQMQCTTCHDPHDNMFGRFLTMDNLQAGLCRTCHRETGFEVTPHALSSAQWNGAGLDPWPHTDYGDVQSNACMNCHRSHHAGGQAELLVYEREEDTCFACHDGSVAAFNIEASFQKFARHPVSQSQGVHQAGESPLQAAGHVECVDCHNPHQAHEAPAQAPFIMGSMQGVSGLDANGVPLTEAVYEYQVCFKCHASESAPPFSTIPRQVATFNLVQEFNPAAPSYHPVVAPGRNADVPSLISPLTTASQIYCIDCHNSDTAETEGGAGPHGSSFEFLLARQYRTGSDVAESPASYALCYGCHSRASLLADESFPDHNRHISEERASCAVCHDPHGIDPSRGSLLNHAHLINFDISVVDPDPVTGRLEYQSTGGRSGDCYLSCHGEAHSPKSY